MDKAYLILASGEVFFGKPLGKIGKTVGELVFTTNMIGYTETLTDKSYYGQIVMQTFPLIGNYGTTTEDYESDKSYVFGYVVRECAKQPSSFRADKTLAQFLLEQNIVGIEGIDVRAVTRITRESGVMNAAIVSGVELKDDQIEEIVLELKSYKVKDAVKSTSCDTAKRYIAENEKYEVALIDYGAKNRIIDNLLRRGVSVTLLPHTAKAAEIVGKYDGVMLSNGAGDPTDNEEEIAEIAKMFGKLPIFGICLGHQLLALSTGAKTEKLKFGHRGGNQPVKELKSNRVYITSQNHGYAVVADSVKRGQVSHINLNDKSCEGIEYESDYAFSVQFHPEGAAGPLDTAYLFDRFTTLLGEFKCQKQKA